MAELVDALVSNTSGEIRAGSTPALGTKGNLKVAFFYMKEIINRGIITALIMLCWEVAVIKFNWANRPGEAYGLLVNLMVIAFGMVIAMRLLMLQKSPLLFSFKGLLIKNMALAFISSLGFYIGVILLYKFVFPGFEEFLYQDKKALLDAGNVEIGRKEAELNIVRFNFSYNGIFIRKFLITLIQSLLPAFAITQAFVKKEAID